MPTRIHRRAEQRRAKAHKAEQGCPPFAVINPVIAVKAGRHEHPSMTCFSKAHGWRAPASRKLFLQPSSRARRDKVPPRTRQAPRGPGTADELSAPGNILHRGHVFICRGLEKHQRRFFVSGPRPPVLMRSAEDLLSRWRGHF